MQQPVDLSKGVAQTGLYNDISLGQKVARQGRGSRRIAGGGMPSGRMNTGEPLMVLSVQAADRRE